MALNLKPASREWAKSIFKRAQELGHPSPETVTAIIHEASRFNPGAAGYNDTIGIGRFTQAQADALGIDPRDPYQSIDAVIGIDMGNLDTMGGDRDAATAAFFMGDDVVMDLAQSGQPVPQEMESKIRRVQAVVPDIVVEVGAPSAVSEFVPPSEPAVDTLSEIIGPRPEDVSLETLYERTKAGDIGGEAFVAEYLRRKFDGKAEPIQVDASEL